MYDWLNFPNVFWENTEWVSEEILTCACIRIKIKLYTVMMEFPQTKWKTDRLNKHLCLVLLQVPKCFGPFQIFCARPKIYLHVVAVKNILCQTKRWFAFSKVSFCAGTKVFEEALYVVKFLGWLKKFGPAQNILGPVKGQGIS